MPPAKRVNGKSKGGDAEATTTSTGKRCKKEKGDWDECSIAALQAVPKEELDRLYSALSYQKKAKGNSAPHEALVFNKQCAIGWRSP
eukprot:15452350-Alexandrium_andersonii.AAC.1